MGGSGKGLHRNTISYVGTMVMGAAGLLIILSIGIDLALPNSSPYLGIFSYMVFPMILTTGLMLFLFGTRRESLRRRKAGTTEARPYPTLDLNDDHQRRKFVWALFGALVSVVVLSFVAYHAFHYTESVPFCGKVCHTVMEPEYTAYTQSPHAKVACVECHVGSGASWYVKSKMSGLRQVWKVATNSYEAPIAVPISNLRPARETCEECHWPEKFFGAQLIQNPHFRYDEQNTAEQMSLLVKTGGGGRTGSRDAGIHWHMILGNTVSFVSTDRQLQTIPWTKVRRGDGSEEEYWSLDDKIDAAGVAALPMHEVTCIDCHNRPSHQYLPPEITVDRAMAGGKIPMDLPWIKKVATDALTKGYPAREEGHKGIETAVREFYKDRSPSPEMGKKIDLAVAGVEEIYDHTVFPEMKVDWTTYAMNIGHRNWPGCFRCHDGRHQRRGDGKVLSRECTVCHTMPIRGPLRPLGVSVGDEGQNWHLWELKGKHADMQCSRCHAAGKRPAPTCAGCHKLDEKAPMMGSCSDCHEKGQEVKPLVACTDCHDSLSGLHKDGGHPNATCLSCHKLHVWKVPETRDTCLGCHKDYKEHHAGEGACVKCHSFRPAAKPLEKPADAT